MDRYEKQDIHFNIHRINGYITDEKLNQEEVLLVHSTNAIGCRNYGISSDLAKKYPYCDIAGFRYTDTDLDILQWSRIEVKKLHVISIHHLYIVKDLK